MKKHILIFATALCFIFNSCTEPESIAKTENDSTAIYEQEKIEFFNEIIKAINNKQPEIINKYINPKYGLMTFKYNGPYPELSFEKSINEYLIWVGTPIVYENIEEGHSPLNEGDGLFAKAGGLYTKYDGKLNLDVFNLETQGGMWEEEELKSHRILEKMCNYRLQLIEKTGSRIYSLFFSINPNERFLLGISYQDVSDKDNIIKDTKHGSTNNWEEFWLKFQTAIKNKDKTKIISMTDEKNFFDGGGGATASEFLNDADISKETGWSNLIHSIKAGVKGKDEKQTVGGYPNLYFVKKNNEWYWQGIVGD